jgi:hypothetical protein
MKSMTFICVLFCFAVPYSAFSQDTASRCTIIDINKDSGTVLIRDFRTGWLKLFKPEALEFAELKIGDSIEAFPTLQQVSKVKQAPRRYPLIQPTFGTPCCEVLEIRASNSMSLITASSSTGEKLRFEMPDSLSKKITPGSKLFTSPTHGYAMLMLTQGSDSTSMYVYGFPFLADEQE